MPYKNKEQQKEYQRIWAGERAKTQYKKRIRKREPVVVFVNALKLERKCTVCKYNRCAEALEFHHIDPKTKTKSVAQLIQSGYNLDVVLTEINKCILLCANCHRELHSRSCSTMD